MVDIDKLLQSYSDYISIPWRHDLAPPQRMIFCVYEEKDERYLRAKIKDFKYITLENCKKWNLFDITYTFESFISLQRNNNLYFIKPNLVKNIYNDYLLYISKEFKSTFVNDDINGNTVSAVLGIGALFGILKVDTVVEKLAPLVKGRLLVFFPGRREGCNYLLLDANKTWNHHAVPIPADNDN